MLKNQSLSILDVTPLTRTLANSNWFLFPHHSSDDWGSTVSTFMEPPLSPGISVPFKTLVYGLGQEPITPGLELELTVEHSRSCDQDEL